jgi:Mn-dependent DtxR family transcriptional regulator
MSSRLSDLQKTILLLCLENRFLTCQDILHQVFGGREYETAHASLSRCLTRLWGRGLIEYWKTLTHYRTGITLTNDGEALARTIMEERKRGRVTG